MSKPIPTETAHAYDMKRTRLVEQIRKRGDCDESVLRAMQSVPREEFVPCEYGDLAYSDEALPIGHGQTISQPYIVALMTSALQLKENARVLEIGTGSGYAAAILSELAAEVYTIERDEPLADAARRRLERLGYSNVRSIHGDGTLGCVEHAPFDAIIVAAGGPNVPETLLDQLRVGGRLVMPVGGLETIQELVCVHKLGNANYETDQITSVRFVPLVGAGGWSV